MGLEDLQKNLYKPETEFENRPAPSVDFVPGAGNHPQGPEKQWQYEAPKKNRRANFAAFWKSLFSLTSLQKKYFLIGGVILLVLVGALVVWIYYWTPFDQSKVEFSISGPESVVSGEDVIYIAKIKNTTKISLNDIKLTFYWPENSILEDGSELTSTMDVDNLTAGQEKEIDFKGKIIGEKGSSKEIKASLSYQPEKIKARFEKNASFDTSILAVPLVLNFDMPSKVSNGQQITVALSYINDSDSTFDNLVMKIEYPDGFKVSSVYPQPQENVWQIGTLQARAEGKILLTGTIGGERGDTKTFKGYVGVVKNNNFASYADTIKSLQISLPALSLEQSVNNSGNYIASPGETLNYSIKYHNNSTVGIPAVKITCKFDTKALDFYSFDLKNKGNFDANTDTIMWDQTTAPELGTVNPGQSGELDFSVKVLDNLPVKNYNDKNFAVASVTTIDSSSVPLALMDQQVKDSLDNVTKVNSKLGIAARGYFQDSLLPNSGPIPPKVGQTTTYTIHWEVTNYSNDVDDVKVEAVLPPQVQWVNKYKPESSALTFDNLTKKLTWNIGKLQSGTGYLSPVKYVVFQVALTPSSTQLGQVVDLLKQSTISGKDDYTGVDLTSTAKNVTSDAQDDPTMSWEKGQVGR
jgi:hypothetical protein